MITGNAINGVRWAIELKESHDKRFYAVVSVDSKKRITDHTYRTLSASQDAGIYLLDKMLLEAGTCRVD